MTPARYDPSRRRFFRSFAGDVLAGAVQTLGAVDALRSQMADGARTYLSEPAVELSPETIDPDAGSAPFRFATPAVLLVVDQRALPQRIAEISVETAAEASWIIGDGAVAEGPVAGQIAALALSLTASRAVGASESVLTALLEGSANALRAARPADRCLAASVDRMMARYRALGSGTSGTSVAAALRLEADTIVGETVDDHARLAAAGMGILPDPPGRSVNILTHGATGPLASGGAGTALGAIVAAHRANRRIHVWVAETRPNLEGSRLTAWELARAGIPHTLMADAATGHLLASGRVDAVLVGAQQVAANGDVANATGTYPLAVLAARHGVPFYVCALVSSVDLATSDGAAIPIEGRDPSRVTSIAGYRSAPLGTAASNPASDITPADLISAVVTDEGVLRAPYRQALAIAAVDRSARRSAEQATPRAGLSSR